MMVLAIETSCDETGAAIVEDGIKLLSNVVASSVALHQKYGGVIPEIAAREQIKVIIPVINEALSQAEIDWTEIDAIAVTVGPGLIGPLLVGVETAKALSLVYKKPLVPVNHLIGHVYANWIKVNSSQFTENNRQPSTVNREPRFPLVALIVSGGHTDLILMYDHGKYKWLGGTKDDAAGEAFDKVARLLGLGYPGGPEIEKVSKRGDASRFTFPRPMIDSADFDFSFSGLKTAVVNLVHSSRSVAKAMERRQQFTVHSKKFVADIAASFQQSIVDVLVTKTVKAVQKNQVKEILVGGGVAANKLLRQQLIVHGSQLGFKVIFPPIELATDNAAMIAAAAYFNFKPEKIEEIQADPGLYFEL